MWTKIVIIITELKDGYGDIF